MVGGRQARWQGGALVIGMLAVLCGLVFGAAPRAFPAEPGSASGQAHTNDPADTSHPAGQLGPAAGSTQEPRESEAAYQHTAQPVDEQPGCRAPLPDDTLPPVLPNSSAHPSAQVPVLEPCAEPESRSALASAHSSPPIRGPDPVAEAPTPVQLSVLRV